MPTIVLGTDADVDCFCAWVSAEQGLPEHAEAGSDLKVCVSFALYWRGSINLIICSCVFFFFFHLFRC